MKYTKPDTSVASFLKQERIFVKDHFISAPLCRKILRSLDKSTWMPCQVNNNEIAKGSRKSKDFYSEVRTSYTIYETAFSPELLKQVRLLEKKIAAMLGTYVNRFEKWQAVNYQPGEKFDTHIDGGRFAEEPSGDRARTILLYLDKPLKGGNTFFRALNREIKPLPGKLVVWNNLLPTGLPDYAMVHAGLPVEEGSKTILVTWERQFRHR